MRSVAKLVLGVALAGCVAGGSAFGGPSRTGATPAPVTNQPGRDMRDPVPYPTRPGDPWVGVDGDQPRRFTKEQSDHWNGRRDPHACTAAVDHCFEPMVWMLETDASRETSKLRSARVHAFHAEDLTLVGTMYPGGRFNPTTPFGVGGASVRHDEAYTAYRTVPATRRNLVPGALAFTLTFPKQHPEDGLALFQDTWVAGVVERVDWELGFVFLTSSSTDPYFISATRTAVISWRPGGKVAVMGAAKRDKLAVSIDEVTLP